VKGKICISIAPPSLDAMLAGVRDAEDLADLIEIRFDALGPGDREAAVSTLRSQTPLIATFRSPGQGGLADVTLDDRRRFWSQDLSKFWAIDIEEDLLAFGIDHPNKIVSFHDFSRVPDDLNAVAERLFSSEPGIVKIAVTAVDAIDAIPVWKLIDRAASAGKQFIPIAMGDAGKWTRILGPANGSPFIYASHNPGSATADGQITATDLVHLYHIDRIGPATQVYGVIGDPVTSSRSPNMHNAAFSSVEMDAIFLPLQVRDAGAFLKRMVKHSTREVDLNFAGCAVTMPHKQTVIPHLDEIDPVASAIGAVNTIKVGGERLLGYNTDAQGFIGPLKRRIPKLAGLRATILGAGGAAKACVYALEREGAEASVFGRTDIASFSAHARDFDILINATPVGMLEGTTQLPISAEDISRVRLVYDLVTRAGDTPLIAMAKALDIPTIDGYEMLVEQGAMQFALWTGKNAPVDVMRAALK
jgi:3-dehydroquinate dehydratase/shikimate dehydrogenase